MGSEGKRERERGGEGGRERGGGREVGVGERPMIVRVYIPVDMGSSQHEVSYGLCAAGLWSQQVMIAPSIIMSLIYHE